MNHRWMSLFWIILTGLALAFITSPAAGQTTFTGLEDVTYEDALGAPLMGMTYPAGHSVRCQDDATIVSDNPADITRINTYTVPSYVLSMNGRVVEVITNTSAQELFGASYSFAVTLNAVTATGERENRIVEVHDGVQRVGAVDDNGQLIAGTDSLAGLGPNGALFNLPASVTQMQIRTYHTGGADQPTACDITERINLPNVFSTETPRQMFDCLGITICPPLDSMFNLDAPDSDPAVTLFMWAVVFSGADSSGGTHVEASDPDRPYHPVFNPLVWKEDCEGDFVR